MCQFLLEFWARVGCAAALIACIVAERASAEARWLGSFVVHFLDQIATLSAADILVHAKVEARQLMAEA